MNPRLAILIFPLLATLPAAGQNVKEEPPVDPVLEAIQEFKQRDKAAANEVTVVLDPVGVPPAPVEKPAEEVSPTKEIPTPEDPKANSPVLVTGKPPEGSSVAESTPGAADNRAEPQAEAVVLEEPEAKKPEEGLSVRVEKLHGGIGSIDPSKINLKAPFPAKPLAQAPAGWHLEAKNQAPPFTREVELSPGSKITLSIRPHLLVPDADGASVFNISEPGYNSTLGYQQTETVGAILSNSIRQLDDDSKRLGAAIDSLQQLLVSLPKPPEPAPIEPPKATPARKR